MRKLIFILLLLAGLLVIGPCLVFGQTAMVLKLSVRRIAVTEIVLDKCEDMRVLFFVKDDILGLLTPDDTLELKRVMIEYTEPGTSVVLCYDLLHGNHPYRVAIIQGKQGVLMYFTPFVRLPKHEKYRRAFANVDMQPSDRPLYGIILSSIPCN